MPTDDIGIVNLNFSRYFPMVFQRKLFSFQGRTQSLALFIFLTALAALPRFYDLGTLGFYGDEETTAFPAKSLALGGNAQTPSGMPYRRALPLTVLNAVSAHSFGVDRELSYRLPSAIFGTLTIPLLFFLARSFFGSKVAFLASLLLALSEWHIITSREARMYAPFLFFYIAAGFYTWHWSKTGHTRYMLLSGLLILITASIHTLGFFAILFALVPIAFIAYFPNAHPLRLLLFALVCGIFAQLYSRLIAISAFDSWISAHGSMYVPSGERTTHYLLPMHLASLPGYAGLLAILGILLGLWAGKLTIIEDHAPGTLLRKLTQFVLAAAFGAMACIGQLYAAAIFALVFFLINPAPPHTIFSKAKTPLIALGGISLIWIIKIVAEQGIYDGIKSVVMFPFPYPAFFAQMFPGVMVFFVLSIFILLMSPKQSGYTPFRAVILIAALPFLAIGIVKEWGGVRYLIETYPFILLASSFGLLKLSSALTNRNGQIQDMGNTAYGMVLLVSVSGILGGHGLPQAIRVATMDYGDSANHYALGFPFYPDHRTTGLFVRRNLGDSDIVIAEDALQQRWYAGKVDYWLHDPVAASIYLYSAPNGDLRDIYVDSIALSAEKISTLDKITDRRIWIITSGEISHMQNQHLNPRQQNWLRSIQENIEPVLIGKDGVSKVFCINCGHLLN